MRLWNAKPISGSRNIMFTRRPHLETFLDACAEWFDLAVWSSASDCYVEEVVDNIFPRPHELKFVWGRSRATYRHVGYIDSYQIASYDPEHFHYIKTLSKVRRKGWPMERILIVDDTPEKCVPELRQCDLSEGL